MAKRHRRPGYWERSEARKKREEVDRQNRRAAHQRAFDAFVERKKRLLARDLQAIDERYDRLQAENQARHRSDLWIACALTLAFLSAVAIAAYRMDKSRPTEQSNPKNTEGGRP